MSVNKIKTAGLSSLIPWMVPVTDALVLQKDGSLLANYSIGGIDIEHLNSETIDSARNSLDKSFSPMGTGHTAFWRVDHRKTVANIPGDVGSPVSKLVNKTHLDSLSNGHYYENRHHLSLLSTPQKGFARFFEKVSLHMENGSSIIKAAYFAIKDSLFAGNNYQFNAKQMVRHIKEFDQLLNTFEGGNPNLKLKRLTLSDQYSFLHSTVNLATPLRNVDYPESMMDSALVENIVVPGAECIRFESPTGIKYVAAVGILNINRNKTFGGILEPLLAIDGELSICTMYRFLNKETAQKEIGSIERHYRFTQFTIRNIIKLLMKQKEDEDSGRLILAANANEALSRVTAENLQFGYANISVLCFGDTADECKVIVDKVARALSKESFGCYQERDNLMATWASTLPGQWSEQERLQLVSTPNVSDLAPILTTNKGEDLNAWLTEQSGQPQQALTIFPTKYKTLTKVNFHVTGGSGHVMILGPTGGGKSVFLNFLTYQTDRYKPRRYTFDRDRSCRIPTILNGGAFIDITGKYQAATKINPLSLLRDRRHVPYVIEWIQLLIESYGQYICDANDVKEIKQQVENFSHFPPEDFRLLNIVGLFPQHLKVQMEPWVQGGKEERFFDHVDDAFELKDEVCIEMGELMDHHPKAAALAIDYFFYRIRDSLKEGDVRPTYIKIEEGSFFITHPIFSKRLNAATVEIRKRNGSIWLATQSLQQIKEAPGFMILQENFKNKIFLPNERANHDLYTKDFGCTDVQYKMIKEGVTNRDYLWVNEKINRLIQASLPKLIVAVTRSDERAQRVFDEHYQSGHPKWVNNYIQSMLSD